MSNTYFQGNPTRLDISRSKFDLGHKATMTMKAGELVPIFCCEVLPGDTFKLDQSFVCRSTTPIAPVMDDADIQIEYYFVPNKLVMSRRYASPSTSDSNESWKAFIGAQDFNLNMPAPADVTLPCAVALPAASGIDFKRSLALYLGYPVLAAANQGSGGTKEMLNPLPLMAFYSIWNEFYRDPNLWSPVTWSYASDSTVEGGKKVVFTGTSTYAGVGSSVSNIYEMAFPAVGRYHGYFGSALPWPQRNTNDVKLPLGDIAPVFAGDTSVYDPVIAGYGRTVDQLIFGKISDLDDTAVTGNLGLASGATNIYGSSVPSGTATAVSPINLFADLKAATAASVNAVRLAFATQRFYEALARGGNRLADVTALFGVTPHDIGDDRPEFLGGKRIPLNVTQVTNTAGTTIGTASQMSIGSTGAFSNTSDSSHYFVKSFDTWGYIIGVACIRHKDSFPNMFPVHLQRKTRLDFYFPMFANIGETPILNKTIDATNPNPNQPFGYQEAWAEYRYLPDRVVGHINPKYGDANLKYWTYCSGTSALANLSTFLNGYNQQAEFDQTLQVTGSTAGFQFLLQAYFDITAVRPMPMYSIPGLLDHH